MLEHNTSTVLMMAGGTGGHIFPALAVAKELQQRGYDVQWLGAKGKMEERLVPEHNIVLHTVVMNALRGKGLKGLLTMPWRLCKAILQARAIIKKVQPKVVVGFGGFASAPCGLAARLLRKPLLIHEQNAVAGMTNKLLSQFANRILLGFSNTLPTGQTVGNPVRQAILDLAAQTKSISEKLTVNILVVGGSLGAQKLNEILPAVLYELAKEQAINVRHQTGKDRQQAVQATYDALNFPAVTVDEFITDMAAAYQWADIIICRSGALTVAEVAIAGIPALFIPFPYAVDNHQTHNAQHLVDAGGAILLAENLCVERPKLITESLQLMLQPEHWQEMHNAQQQVGQQWANATVAVADACEQLMGEA